MKTLIVLFSGFLMTEEKERISIKIYLIIFILLFFMSIVPFTTTYITNFTMNSVLVNDYKYNELDFNNIVDELKTCQINEYRLICDNEFDYSQDDYTFKYISMEIPDSITSYSEGFTFYENAIIYTYGQYGSLNYVFRYPKELELSSYFTSKQDYQEQVLNIFYHVQYLINGAMIILNLLLILFIYRLLYLLGLLIIPLIVKFIPKFKRMSLKVSFKILTYSLLYPTIIFYFYSLVFGVSFTMNIVFSFAVGLLIFINTLNLFVRNSTDKKRRLDSEKYL